jgi:hypothetical protein
LNAAAGAKTRILAVVEPAVANALDLELRCGRLPPATEIEIVELPAGVRKQLENFRLLAAEEVGSARG